MKRKNELDGMQVWLPIGNTVLLAVSLPYLMLIARARFSLPGKTRVTINVYRRLIKMHTVFSCSYCGIVLQSFGCG